MQYSTQVLGDNFQKFDKLINKEFPPEIFLGESEGMLSQKITGFPYKQTGMAIPDTTYTAHRNWTASCVVTIYLVVSL